jgi:phage terminase large subunit-like protein
LKRTDIWLDAERVERVFKFYEDVLKLSEGQFENKPFLLHTSQSFIIGSIMGWVKYDEDSKNLVRRFRRAYIEMGKGNGKALAIDTPIPTVKGWSTMGDLRPGDRVFDENGNPCTVIKISGHMRDRPCYKMRFNDGSEIVADADHLWVTSALRTGLPKGPKSADAPRKGQPSIRTTAEIYSTLKIKPSKSKHPQALWNHRIDVAGALQLPDVELPVPPYVLGAWLGDGDSDSARLTVAYDDWEIVRYIEAEGISCREQVKHSETVARVIMGSAGRGGNNVTKLQTKLRMINVLNNKHIPSTYMRSSENQRMKLLQGLMDTDGTISVDKECEFCVCSERLAYDTIELITSLGFKPTLSISDAVINHRVVGTRYRVRFHALSNNPVFRLSRKVSRLGEAPKTRALSRGRMIVACDPVPSVTVQCISVDSPSQMFLCGRGLIPTHNSPLVGGLGLYGMISDREPGAQIYSAGATREQAGILFQDAVNMAMKAPKLNNIITFGGNVKIFKMTVNKSPQNGSSFVPLSRQAGKTGSGPRPHFALCDEVHEHPDRGIMEMLERGFKFRTQPLIVMITNSGTGTESVAYEEHSHSVAILNQEIEDDTTFAYVCALDVDDDPLTDFDCHIKANPLLGVTITKNYLINICEQARQIPGKLNSIMRLHFCKWTDAATAWVTREVWESIEDATLDINDFKGAVCNIGLDLSQTTDMTARALVFDDGFMTTEDGFLLPKFAAFVYAYTPKDTVAIRCLRDKAPYDVWVAQGHLTATPGKTIRFDIVANDILNDMHNYDVQNVAYDRWLIKMFEYALDEAGASNAPICEHPQGTTRHRDNDLWMPGSINEIEKLILEKRLRVHINPVLRSAVARSTFWTSPAELRRFEKAKSTGRIDAVVALTMGVGAAMMRHVDSVSIYDKIAQKNVDIVKPDTIDYDILNNPKHPRHAAMIELFERKRALDDDY